VLLVESAGRHCRLRAVGPFDMSNRHLLAAAIRTVSAGGFAMVEIDVRDVTFIDAGVIRVLVEGRELLSGVGCVLRIVGASGACALVLDLTRTRADLCEPASPV
jgi:anti-anti-sigma factor